MEEFVKNLLGLYYTCDEVNITLFSYDCLKTSFKDIEFVYCSSALFGVGYCNFFKIKIDDSAFITM